MPCSYLPYIPHVEASLWIKPSRTVKLHLRVCQDEDVRMTAGTHHTKLYFLKQMIQERPADVDLDALTQAFCEDQACKYFHHFNWFSKEYNAGDCQVLRFLQEHGEMQTTLALIKPDATPKKRCDIQNLLVTQGFEILAKISFLFERETAIRFYAHAKTALSHDMFEQLVNLMVSGTSIFLLLRKTNAILHWRTCMVVGYTSGKKKKPRPPLRNAARSFGIVHGAKSKKEVVQQLSVLYGIPKLRNCIQEFRASGMTKDKIVLPPLSWAVSTLSKTAGKLPDDDDAHESEASFFTQRWLPVGLL